MTDARLCSRSGMPVSQPRRRNPAGGSPPVDSIVWMAWTGPKRSATRATEGGHRAPTGFRTRAAVGLRTRAAVGLRTHAAVGRRRGAAVGRCGAGERG